MKVNEKIDRYLNEDYQSDEYQSIYKEISKRIGDLQKALGKHQKSFKKSTDDDMRYKFVGDLRDTMLAMQHIPGKIHILERRK